MINNYNALKNLTASAISFSGLSPTSLSIVRNPLYPISSNALYMT